MGRGIVVTDKSQSQIKEIKKDLGISKLKPNIKIKPPVFYPDLEGWAPMGSGVSRVKEPNCNKTSLRCLSFAVVFIFVVLMILVFTGCNKSIFSPSFKDVCKEIKCRNDYQVGRYLYDLRGTYVVWDGWMD